MSSQSKPHRAAAKSTPFSQQGPSRSRATRSNVTTSLRKAKRGQLVDMKRHMKLPASSAVSNPYLGVDDRIRDTISAAESIVRCCQESINSVALTSSLEQLCVLISPSEFDTATKIGDINREIMGNSYDSSLAGIAANAILTRVCQYKNETRYLAFFLADALATILNSAAGGDPSLQAMQEHAAIALIQLSTIEPPPAAAAITSYDQDQFSPYGHLSPEQNNQLLSAPTSWCNVLVNSQALHALIQTIRPPSSYNVQIVEKCVWSIGNLAGDSIMAREALVGMGAVSLLVGCISYGLSSLDSNNAVHGSSISLLRNSVWGLSNFVRNGMACSKDFINVDFPSLLLLSCSVLTTCAEKASNDDVLTELCWLLAFLVDNDPESIEFVCHKHIVPSILATLSLATDATCEMFESNSVTELGLNRHHHTNISLCLIPICRIIKRIAFDVDYVSTILPQEIFVASKQTTLANPTETCLAQLITLGTLGVVRDASEIAAKASEAAGACLCFAGLSMAHPSSIACRILVPALCRALTNQLSTFDMKIEVIWALWNAVNNPLEQVNEEKIKAIYNEAEFKEFQKKLLLEIGNSSSPDIVHSLTALLSTNDRDAIDPALSLINTLLRQLGASISSGNKLPVMFEEAGLVDALWRICDNETEESFIAELAASILDDFYERDEEEYDEELIEPPATGGKFHFQAPSMTGDFDFSECNPSFSRQETFPSMGRGRGRGQQMVPAWMTIHNKQN